MVRLVFRPYTQVLRSICTSESLRASIRVSPDFALPKHSSPSFGSQQICSYSNLSSKTHGWSILDYIIRNDIIHTSIYRKDISLLSLRINEFHYSNTCICVRLLGPCFKTGRLEPFCQYLKKGYFPQYITLPYLYKLQLMRSRKRSSSS